MNTTQNVLLIVVSAASLLLLIYTLVAVVLVNKLIREVRTVVSKAQSSVDSAAQVVDRVRSTVGSPSIVSSLISGIIDKQIRKGGKK